MVMAKGASCVLLVPGRPLRGLPNRMLPAMASQAVPTVRQMLASFGRTLTTDELANILHVSKRTIYRRIKAKVIPSRRSGGQLRFDPGKERQGDSRLPFGGKGR